MDEDMDVDYREIVDFSNLVYGLARRVLNKEKIDADFEKIEEKLTEMEARIGAVREENKSAAKKYLSEALLDLNYIKNPQIGITSLRIGHILMNQNNRLMEEK